MLIKPVVSILINRFKFLHEEDIELLIQDKKYTWEFLKDYCSKNNYDLDSMTIVLGADEEKDLLESIGSKNPKWRYAPEILNRVKRIVVDRDSVISSTKVRKIFYSNPYVEYNMVSDLLPRPSFNLIKKFGLYWQDGFEETARIEENKFLRKYDGSKFPKPSATVDLLVYKNDEILLIRRKGHPYKGYWAIPGGFFDVNTDENLEEAASRELKEETNISHFFGKEDQFRIYSDLGVDPRGRIIDTVFSVELDSNSLQVIKAKDDAAAFSWFKINELPRMAFNHKSIIEDFFREKEKAKLVKF